MDRYIIIKKQKSSKPFTRKKLYDKILEYIQKNRKFCIYGQSGVGKTFLIKEILKNFQTIELTHEILRSKIATHEFLSLSKHSRAIVLVDEIDSDYQGWKELVEFIKKGNNISKGAFIIITKPRYIVGFCENICIPPLKVDEIIELGRQKYPNKTIEFIKTRAEKSKGNLRTFFYSFDFSDTADILLSPKETVHNLLCPSEFKPNDYIGKTIEDHGYSWGIVHENYPRSRILTMEDAASISENMSIADMYDNSLYNGEWELNKFFYHEAIIHPCIKLKQSLCRETLNPGSAWTKYNNMRMRMGKVKYIKQKQIYNKITIGTLMLIKDKCIQLNLNVIPLLRMYKLASQDMDVINHLALETKIKPKLLNNIKKELRKNENLEY
jgi:GTPase SAR1 family protein